MMKMHFKLIYLVLLGAIVACNTGSDKQQQEDQVEIKERKNITEGDKSRYNLNESDKMLHDLPKSPSVDTLVRDTL